MAEASAPMLADLLSRREASLPTALPMSHRRLEVTQRLRFMPGRRAVFAGRYDDRPVIIKLFSKHPRSRREFVQEQQILRELNARKVPVPQVVASQDAADGAILLLEHLGEVSARQWLEQADEQQTAQLIADLVSLTGAMHNQGVAQRDIHLANYICHQDRWHVIDAGDVVVRAGPLPKQQRLDNLCWLLAQFPPLSLPSASDIAACYGSGISAGELAKRLASVRDERLQRLVRKSMRDCTEYRRIRHGALSGMCRREQQGLVSDLLEGGLDRMLEQGEVLKRGNSATVGLVEVAGEMLVIKRYNVKNRLKLITRQWKSRAANSWKNAAYLGLVDIATPQTLCFVSRRKYGLRTEEYLVCRFAAGEMLPDLCARSEEAGQQALTQLARFFATMELMKFSHGDSKYTNFIFDNGRLQVLDLDGMRRWVRRGLAADLAYQAQRLFEDWRPHEALARDARRYFERVREQYCERMETWL